MNFETVFQKFPPAALQDLHFRLLRVGRGKKERAFVCVCIWDGITSVLGSASKCICNKCYDEILQLPCVPSTVITCTCFFKLSYRFVKVSKRFLEFPLCRCQSHCNIEYFEVCCLELLTLVSADPICVLWSCTTKHVPYIRSNVIFFDFCSHIH